MVGLPRRRGGHAQQQPQSVARAQPAGAARGTTASTAATSANVMAEPAEEEEEGAACVEANVMAEPAAVEEGAACVEEEDTRAHVAPIMKLEDESGVEEDTRAQVTPTVKLEQPLLMKLEAIAVTTGEEGADVYLDINPKISGSDKDGNQSEERLMGPVKLLKHEETSGSETDNERMLYFYKLRVQELADERDFLQRQLDSTNIRLNEVESVNKKLLDENQKFQRNVEPNIESSAVVKRVAYCHNLFVCGNEVGAVRLVDHLADSGLDLLYIFKIPGAISGDPYWTFDKIGKMSPFCKTIFLGLTEIVYRLHRTGLTLAGKFSLNDFYWTLDKKVKLRSRQKKYLARRTKSKMKLDYTKLHEIMLNILEDCKVAIPADLQYFLALMKADPIKYQALLRYNLCLMDDISKREYTITLFTQMEEMDKEDADKFDMREKEYRTELIFNYMTIPKDWGDRVCTNKFVKQVYETMKVDKGNRSLTQRNFIQFIRHCMVHLPQKSFDEDKKTQYLDTNIVDMVEVHTPSVFSQFQMAMHKLRRLGYPHLIRIMKA